jgi:hypothetical protein
VVNLAEAAIDSASAGLGITLSCHMVDHLVAADLLRPLLRQFRAAAVAVRRLSCRSTPAQQDVCSSTISAKGSGASSAQSMRAERWGPLFNSPPSPELATGEAASAE